jgi:hypothetical protein
MVYVLISLKAQPTDIAQELWIIMIVPDLWFILLINIQLDKIVPMARLNLDVTLTKPIQLYLGLN